MPHLIPTTVSLWRETRGRPLTIVGVLGAYAKLTTRSQGPVNTRMEKLHRL